MDVQVCDNVCAFSHAFLDAVADLQREVLRWCLERFACIFIHFLTRGLQVCVKCLIGDVQVCDNVCVHFRMRFLMWWPICTARSCGGVWNDLHAFACISQDTVSELTPRGFQVCESV